MGVCRPRLVPGEHPSLTLLLSQQQCLVHYHPREDASKPTLCGHFTGAVVVANCPACPAAKLRSVFDRMMYQEPKQPRAHRS